MNHPPTTLAGLTAISVLAPILLACGGTGLDNAEAGGQDATANNSDQNATADSSNPKKAYGTRDAA
jgi:hypothetical protein